MTRKLEQTQCVALSQAKSLLIDLAKVLDGLLNFECADCRGCLSQIPQFDCPVCRTRNNQLLAQPHYLLDVVSMGCQNLKLCFALVVLHVVDADASVVGTACKLTWLASERERVYSVVALVLTKRVLISVLNQLHKTAVVTRKDQLSVRAELAACHNVVEAARKL